MTCPSPRIKPYSVQPLNSWEWQQERQAEQHCVFFVHLQRCTAYQYLAQGGLNEENTGTDTLTTHTGVNISQYKFGLCFQVLALGRPPQVDLVPPRYFFFANVPVIMPKVLTIWTFGRCISLVQCLFYILKCVPVGLVYSFPTHTS